MLQQCLYHLLFSLFEKHQPDLINLFDSEYLKFSGINSNNNEYSNNLGNIL